MVDSKAIMCWWMIQSDQLLLFEGYHDTSAKDALLSFLKSDRPPSSEVSWYPSPRSFVRPILPRSSWTGAVCTGVFSLRPHFFDLRGWPGVTGWATDFFDILPPLRASSSFISLWSGGASLHRDEERLSVSSDRVTSVWVYQSALQHGKGNSAQPCAHVLSSPDGHWEKMDNECQPLAKCCLKALGCPNVRVSCGLAALPEEEQRMSRGCLCDSSG